MSFVELINRVHVVYSKNILGERTSRLVIVFACNRLCD